MLIAMYVVSCLSAVSLVLSVMLQTSKAEGLGAAMGGGGAGSALPAGMAAASSSGRENPNIRVLSMNLLSLMTTVLLPLHC